MDRCINLKAIKKSRILIIVCGVGAFACSAYLANMAAIQAAPAEVHLGYHIPFTNTPMPLVNHYKVNDVCQYIQASSDKSDMYLGPNARTTGDEMQIFRNLTLNDPVYRSGNAELWNQVEYKKIWHEAMVIEINKMVDNFEINPDFAKKMTDGNMTSSPDPKTWDCPYAKTESKEKG